jgi:hypothetical protein
MSADYSAEILLASYEISQWSPNMDSSSLSLYLSKWELEIETDYSQKQTFYFILHY